MLPLRFTRSASAVAAQAKVPHNVPYRSSSAARAIVEQALFSRLHDLDVAGSDDAFFVCDLGKIRRQYRHWTDLMPVIHPHYAIKCNPDPHMIACLAEWGAGFDCASQSEMQLALDAGARPEQIIFAHCAKQLRCLRFAKRHGIRRMTFDNADELLKISRECPEAQLVLRIIADDPTATCRLSEKFGASPEEASELLLRAKELRLETIGVSFHVGSGATSAEAYGTALANARAIIDHGASLGHTMSLIDIGGGFSQDTLSSFAPSIRQSLREHFPADSIKIVAEPGRYFAEGAYTLACNVSARRTQTPYPEEPHTKRAMLFLNDGVYGSFSSCVYEKLRPVPSMVLRKKDGHFTCVRQGSSSRETCRYSLWGPTCDSADYINKEVTGLPDISVGDWLCFDNMGAYSMAVTTRFNGFTDRRHVTYVDSSDA